MTPSFEKLSAQHVDAIMEQAITAINQNAGGHSDSTDYFNNLDHPIYIGKRDGTKVLLKPMHNPNIKRGLFITRRVYTNQAYATINLPDAAYSQAHLAVHEAHNEGLRHSIPNPSIMGSFNYTSIFQYVVEPQDISMSNLLYIKTLDIIVTTLECSSWYHPFSSDGRIMETKYRQADELNGNTHQFYFCAELVTHRDDIKPKYINLGNRIYQVPVFKSNMREAGLYIGYKGYTSLTHPPSDRIAEFYPMADVVNQIDEKGKCKLPYQLFDTIQDALVEGDLERKRKHELENSKHQLEKQKLELDQQKIDLDNAKADIERLKIENERLKQESVKQAEEKKLFLDSEQYKVDKSLLELKHELEAEKLKHEAEIARLKKEAEADAAKVKQSAELLKWIPTILAGMISLATLLVKTNNQK